MAQRVQKLVAKSKNLLSRRVRKATSLYIAFAVGSFCWAAEALATEWNVSLWGTPRATTKHVEKLADLVREKTGGEFSLNISYGGLSTPRENLDGIAIGAFEMAQFCVGHNPQKTPALSVLELPLISIEGLAENRFVSEEVYKHPAVRSESEAWNAFLLMPTPMPQQNLLGYGNAPNAVSDLSGLKIRAGGSVAAALSAAGANPQYLPFSETADAFEQGNISAVALAPHSHIGMGTTRIGSWWTANLNIGAPQCPIAVNKDALDDLSEEHKEALLGSVDEALDHYVDNYLNSVISPWMATLSENGIQTIVYDAETLGNFQISIEEPISSAWMEALPGALLSSELLEFVKGKSKPRCCRDDEMCRKCPK